LHVPRIIERPARLQPRVAHPVARDVVYEDPGCLGPRRETQEDAGQPTIGGAATHTAPSNGSGTRSGVPIPEPTKGTRSSRPTPPSRTCTYRASCARVIPCITASPGGTTTSAWAGSGWVRLVRTTLNRDASLCVSK